MKAQPRRRLWVESALAALSTVFFLLTLLWNNWIELAFGVDPDRRSGALEWAITLASVAGALASAVLALHEWRRRPAIA